MKWAVLLLLVALLQVPLLGESQTLNFSGKDIPLKDVFKIMKCQAGILFFYDDALLKEAKPVTINWKNTSLEKALNEIFKDEPFTWVLEGKTIAVIRKPAQILAPAEVSKHSLKNDIVALEKTIIRNK